MSVLQNRIKKSLEERMYWVKTLKNNRSASLETVAKLTWWILKLKGRLLLSAFMSFCCKVWRQKPTEPLENFMGRMGESAEKPE